MAEKEKRIRIEQFEYEGFGHCVGFYTEGVGEYFCVWNGEKEPITEAICNNCPHDNSMSRQEAINRIAKALCADDVIREGYYQMAEAALNSLLEGK